jgi:hypothetical protein
MEILSRNVWMPTLNKSFEAAVASKENRNSDDSINWNFVEADVYMDVLKHDEAAIVLADLAEAFDSAADTFLANN